MGLLESTETHPDAELAEMPKNYAYVLLRTLLSVARISKLHQRTISNSQNRSSMETAPTLGSRLGKQYPICFEQNYSGFRYYESTTGVGFVSKNLAVATPPPKSP